MNNIEGIEGHIERVDDLPVIYGLLKQMGVQGIIDSEIESHGNWQGLSVGWVVTIWLMHILSEQNHLMEPMQAWVRQHLVTLRGLTKQPVAELDFSDDRLALCLLYLHTSRTWQAIESQLGARLLRVYELAPARLRLDATVGTVYHDPAKHVLFQVGKAKNGQYATQFKLMLASLDPLGLPLVVDVVPGNRADDPLYLPSYRRAKGLLQRAGVLVVGDSKMSALTTRGTIVAGQDHYLTPLAAQPEEADLLAELLAPWPGREEEATRIFLPQDIPTDGSDPDPAKAIAYGFEVTRPQCAQVAGHTVSWEERLLVVRSFSYVKTMQEGLQRRLDAAEAALRELTPARQRGKHQIEDEASLLAAIARIEKQYRVQGFFQLDYQPGVAERQVRGYRGKPARFERQVRFQLHVQRNDAAIAAAHFQAGWRLYVTNAPAQRLSLAQAVLAYRDQYLAENVFRRLQGKFLAITPLYIQRDDHAQGLFHLLTLGARLLALGDYRARQALARAHSELTGIYAGNPKRGSARPTTERMLSAFAGIHLLILATGTRPQCFLTRLSDVQERILALLGLPHSLFTDLQAS
ncbi:MAG: transposase [Chloroflexi bacterium]|nr:MAG: transposase [Chloroflexota bacterium]